MLMPFLSEMIFYLIKSIGYSGFGGRRL